RTARDVQPAQAHLQRGGAAADGDPVREPAMACELLLELGAVPPERQLPTRQNLLNPLRDPATVLGGEVDSRARDRRATDRAVRCVLAAPPTGDLLRSSSHQAKRETTSSRAHPGTPTTRLLLAGRRGRALPIRAKPSLCMTASSPYQTAPVLAIGAPLTLGCGSALFPRP